MVVALVAFIFLVDGFDTQSLAFAGATMVRDFGLSIGALGPILVWSMIGALVGAVGFGVIGDAFGRRLSLTICVAVFSIATLLTGLAADWSHLAPLRFAAGIGLGGALPSLYAVTAATAAPGRRAWKVSLAACGTPLGGVVAGLVCAQVTPHFGWRPVFFGGGAVPLAALPLIWLLIPRHAMSPATARRSGPERWRQVGEALFGERRWATSPILWLVCLTATLSAYFLVNWTPALADRAGLALQTGLLAGVALNLGGIVGVLCISRLIDRYGPLLPLGGAFALAALTVAAIGFSIVSPAFFVGNLLVAGMVVIGGSMGVGTLATLLYPDEARGTGVGLALAASRIGGIAGPLVGSLLVNAGAGSSKLFPVVGAVSLIPLAGLILLCRGVRLPEAPRSAGNVNELLEEGSDTAALAKQAAKKP